MSDIEPFDLADLDLPEPVLVECATFEAFFKGFSTGNRDGDLILTLGVSPDAKHDAFPITDYPGQMLEIVVHRKVLPDLADLGGCDDDD